MKRNEHIADFGVLNDFFGKEVSPVELINTLVDTIEEYSRLAILNEEQIIPRETACRISILGILNRELRKTI